MNSIQSISVQQQSIPILRQIYGDRLFVIVRDSLEAAPLAAAGLDSPLINPYKITGMIVEACTLVELWNLLCDSKSLSDIMLEACDLLQHIHSTRKSSLLS